MQPIMSVKDVREFERELTQHHGIDQAELMRRAGAVVAMQAANLVDQGSVVVMCGMGNNGGDGWVCADDLARHGYDVAVVSAATPAVISAEPARRMAKRAAEMGVPVHVAPEEAELERLLDDADVVVDACFGIGFHGEMPEPYASWARAVDEMFVGQVVCVDVPSGIDASTGMAAGAYFTADYTVTMFAIKPGLVSGVGRAASGALVVAPILPGEQGLQTVQDATDSFVLEERDYLDAFPEADPLQDKYSRGRVLVVAGSSRYPGAAIMAAIAASRAGAGYVTLAVPDPVVPIAQAHLLSIPVVGLAHDVTGAFGVSAVDEVRELASHADVVLAGPGMTRSDGACEVVRALLGCNCALVLDADALNLAVRICAGSAEMNPQALRREAPLVLTPHRRELARLLGGDLERTASLSGAMEGAQALAWAVGSSNFAVVAKGEVTAVAGVDAALVVSPGPAALATAGTGDVLAGVCAGFLAQACAQTDTDELDGGIESGELLMLMAGADRVHAIAGELAVGERGTRGVMAPDVAGLVGRAFDELQIRADRDFDEADSEDDEPDNLDFVDESQVETSAEARAALHAAATAASLGEDDEPLEEPETPEQQQARLERAQRAAEVRRSRVAESRHAPVPGEMSVPVSSADDENDKDKQDATKPAELEVEPQAEAASIEESQPASSDSKAASEADETEESEQAQEPETSDSTVKEGKEGTSSEEFGAAVPPFLARAVAEEEAQAETAEEDTPASDVEAGDSSDSETEGDGDASLEESDEHRPTMLEEFHRRATKHAGITPKVPPEERPSVSKKNKSQK